MLYYVYAPLGIHEKNKPVYYFDILLYDASSITECPFVQKAGSHTRYLCIDEIPLRVDLSSRVNNKWRIAGELQRPNKRNIFHVSSSMMISAPI